MSGRAANTPVARPLWRTMLELTAPATTSELAALTGASANAVQHRLSRWVKAGFVDRTRPASALYRLTAAADPASLPYGMGAAMESGDALGHAEIALRAGMNPGSVRSYLARFVRAGAVEKVDGDRPVFWLIDGAPAVPPAVGPDGEIGRPNTQPTAQDRIWRAIRNMPARGFDFVQLQLASQTSRAACSNFVNVLLRAGYLTLTRRGNGAKGTWSSYRVLRTFGPRTPVVTHARDAEGSLLRTLIDGNSGERTDISPGAVDLRVAKPRREVSRG